MQFSQTIEGDPKFNVPRGYDPISTLRQILKNRYNSQVVTSTILPLSRHLHYSLDLNDDGK